MPEQKYTEWFRFSCQDLPQEEFHVVSFSGAEGLNQLFVFTIDLVSRNSELEAEEVLNSLATLTVLRPNQERAQFSGYPVRFEQTGFFHGYSYYRVELRPAFWKMTQMVSSRIFLDQTMQEAVNTILTSERAFHFEHEFSLFRNDYPKPEFAMQYNEDNYSYICWRLEKEGAYFYFATGKQDGGDRVIFADGEQSHELASSPTLRYAPPSGLAGEHGQEIITAFALVQTPLAHQVVVRDYDWKNPQKVVVGMAELSENGLGDVYLSNEHVSTDSEAKRVAKIRAEQLKCASRYFVGSSAVAALRPGFHFTLSEHFNKKLNQKYLVTTVTHQGSQEAFLSLGLGIPLADSRDHYFYHNDFTAIEASCAYRPARQAPRAKIDGVMRAFIDSASDASRPEVDDYGRYKVIFPFDLSGRNEGKASSWVRRAQEQANKQSGLMMPLRAGTEVTLSFIDGNPDEPIISGSLPNGETGSLSHSQNTNLSGIRSAGGSQLSFNDRDKKQGFSLTTAGKRGRIVSAGSPTSTTDITDYSLQNTSLLGTEMAGLGKNLMAGHRAMQWAYKPDALVYGSLINEAVNSIATKIFNTAADATGEDSVNWWADGVNLLSAILGQVLDVATMMSIAPNYYGVSLTSDRDNAMMRLETLPKDLKSMVVYAIVSILGSGFAITSDSVNIGSKETTVKNDYANALNDAIKLIKKYKGDAKLSATEPSGGEYTKDNVSEESKGPWISDLQTIIDDVKKEEKVIDEKTGEEVDKDYGVTVDECNEAISCIDSAWTVLYDGDSDEYYQSKRKEAAHTFVNTTLTDVIPELISVVFLLIGGISRSESKMRLGGVQLSAQQANVNISARDAIGLHTARGLMVNTENLSVDDNNELNSNTTVESPYYIYRDKEHKANGSDTKYKNKTHLLWGISDENGEVKGDYKEGKLPANNISNAADSLTYLWQQQIKNYQAASAVAMNYYYMDNTNNKQNRDYQGIFNHRFIAHVTEHVYEKAKWSNRFYSGNSYCHAHQHVWVANPLPAVDNGSTVLWMLADNSATITDIGENPKSKVKTGIVGDVMSVSENHGVVLRVHGGGVANKWNKPASWMELNNSKARVATAVSDNDTNAYALLTQNSKVELGFFNSADALQRGLVVENEKLTLGANVTPTVTLIKDGNVVIDSNNKEVHVEEVVIKKADIAGKNGSPITIHGNVLKVLK